MKYSYLTLLVILLSCGCKVQQNSIIEAKPLKGELYFPIKTENVNGEINGKLNTFKNNWYSKHLYSLKEPVLKNLKLKNAEIYRYTNLGTWSNPVSLTIEKTDSTIYIFKRRTNGKGGYDAGRLIENKTKKVELADWLEFKEKIKVIDFWNLNSHNEIFGMDGSEWILEGYKDGKYHFVTRWTPDHYGDERYVEVCNFLGKLIK
ncbi:hypothetical protein ACE1ET_17650 [Saccharicrinis sp. FJH62]|uniref:hypothetical protein n=1 Tax=Saccharicrinis sp. FJH62 TaxID=3344657 RepID=UPI0035D5287F